MQFRQAGRSLVVDTPAKLNLFLEVLGKRADGYHELETLMVSVGLYDTLSFTEDYSQAIGLRCLDSGNDAGVVRGGEVPAGDGNLIVQAASLLRKYAGIKKGVRIDLLKRIPVAAGLAGGSSDAAATLMALNRLWKLKLSVGELYQLASQLGSDVVFFLAPCTVAVCRGRGEVIEPLHLPLSLHFVIARPHTGLSTARVFRNCRAADVPRRVDSLVETLRNGHIGNAVRFLHNSLQAPAEELNSEVKHLKSVFSQQPVLGHMMSGSGTAYFGVCANRYQARMVAARLRQAQVGRVFVARGQP